MSAERDPHGQAPGEIPHMPAGGSSRTAMYPLTGSWANSPLGIRGIKVFIEKTQKAGVHHFQGITEAGSRPLLRQPSSTHTSAAPRHAGRPWRSPNLSDQHSYCV